MKILVLKFSRLLAMALGDEKFTRPAQKPLFELQWIDFLFFCAGLETKELARE